MPFVIPEHIERLYPPTTISGVADGDWIDISTVFDARVQHEASTRGAIPIGGNEWRWDAFGYRQALLELVIRAWSDPSPVTPEAIGSMHPSMHDWLSDEYNRLSGQRGEEEKKDSTTDSSQPSSTAESSPVSSAT